MDFINNSITFDKQLKEMLYHRKIGFPDTLKIPSVTLQLGYTTHARQRKDKDYNLLVVPTIVKIVPKNVIEIDTEDDININKMLIRIQYTKSQDMILVLNPNFKKRTASVITLWVNDKRDHHSNNKKEYSIPKTYSIPKLKTT